MLQSPGELIVFLTEVVRSNNVKQTGTNDPSNAVFTKYSRKLSQTQGWLEDGMGFFKAKCKDVCFRYKNHPA